VELDEAIADPTASETTWSAQWELDNVRPWEVLTSPTLNRVGRHLHRRRDAIDFGQSPLVTYTVTG
jgi:hypothetical protein